METLNDTTGSTSISASASNNDDSGRIVSLYWDLSKPETIAQAALQSQDVDIVINNAGVLSRTGPLQEEVFTNLQHKMEVNVYGLIHMAQHYAPLLKNSGIFIQLNSVASF
jgi:NADP-dependent 3-hydroxy acid dehydrogenase YdfG